MPTNIVVLENEPLLMRALVRALARLDVTVLQAQTKQEAMRLLQGHEDTAVLVTDYFLNAGETSEALLNWVRAYMPCCRCVLMSGQDASALDLNETLYDLFVAKPFSIMDFRQIIRDQVEVYESLCGMTQVDCVS
tara:strand:- start:6 stop:410 length:405 start_codon:yes stop_codon:yes gene_type:complete